MIIILSVRCHIPSGKILWLCEHHQTAPRVTVMEDDIILDEHESTGVNHEKELLEALKNLKKTDKSRYPGE